MVGLQAHGSSNGGLDFSLCVSVTIIAEIRFPNALFIEVRLPWEHGSTKLDVNEDLSYTIVIICIWWSKIKHTYCRTNLGFDRKEHWDRV